MADERVICITHLRDCLGIAYQHVVRNDEPVFIQRYGKTDAAIVPLWQWRFFQELEAAMKAGRCPLAEENGVTCPCFQ